MGLLALSQSLNMNPGEARLKGLDGAILAISIKRRIANRYSRKGGYRSNEFVSKYAANITSREEN
jgi:hypothetical protein